MNFQFLQSIILLLLASPSLALPTLNKRSEPSAINAVPSNTYVSTLTSSTTKVTPTAASSSLSVINKIPTSLRVNAVNHVVTGLPSSTSLALVNFVASTVTVETCNTGLMDYYSYVVDNMDNLTDEEKKRMVAALKLSINKNSINP